MLFTQYKPLVVQEIEISRSPVAIGKIFKGDYARSSSYIMDVISELSGHGISPVQGQTLGIFYDNPSGTAADQLTSFQGVFVESLPKDIPSSLTQFSFNGRYLYVTNNGLDVMKAIFEAYDVMFKYAREKKVNVSSPAGYQVLTQTGESYTAEILMKLE